MATIQVTEYTSYNFDESEAITACVFSELQTAYLSNELAKIAITKAEIGVQPDNPYIFQLEHEYLRGQLEAIKMLIATSENNKESLMLHLQDMAKRQEYDLDNHINTQG